MAGLYIHIPFCESKCAYCDFYSLPRTTYADEYIDALCIELDARIHELHGEAVTTIYLGGGTPSILSPHCLDKLLGLCSRFSPEEFTIEVNPEHVTPELTRRIADSPINRVSMGVQSLCDRELAAISRRHSARQAIEAAERLRQEGIHNLSLDLIFGLPLQTMESWRYSVEQVIALRPTHISAYSLMYEPGTRLSAMLAAGRLTEPPQELSDAMYTHLCAALADAGFQHYEISNFALPDFHSRHNSAYWNLTPYLGLGASAHSFDGTTRRHNPADIRRYLKSPAASATAEETTPEERINEYLMIRLRTAQGLRLADLTARFGAATTARVIKAARKHLRAGHLTLSADTLAIPQRQWLIADSILVDLFMD